MHRRPGDIGAALRTGEAATDRRSARFFRPLAYHSERREESHNPPRALFFRNLAAPRKYFRFRARRFGFFDVAVTIVE